MHVGLQVLVVPIDDDAIHITVTPMIRSRSGAYQVQEQLIRQNVPKSGVVADDKEFRLWINSVVRLVARTLEDELYESTKAAMQIVILDAEKH